MRIKTFRALQPPAALASQVASPPYDVVDSAQARVVAGDNEKCFLHIVRSEIDLPEETPLYSDAVYAQAVSNFQKFKTEGWLIRDEEPGLYWYRQILKGLSQTGLVCVCHTQDYEDDIIKKHEVTLKPKEDDRTRHVKELRANTGPVFLTYRDVPAISALMHADTAGPAVIDFTAPDGVQHQVWKAGAPDQLEHLFASVPFAYVADGHHRSASAARVSKEMAAQNPAHTGEEHYNWFLSVLFPAGDLNVLAYNRLVKDLNGSTPEELLAKISAAYAVSPAAQATPSSQGQVHMYVAGAWHAITLPVVMDDPVETLDVRALQREILDPILGVTDPRNDPRIAFKGGFDANEQMQKLVDSGKFAVAFSLYPVTVGEVMAVADAGRIMPPKSTWFEPKLRSGLFVNALDA